MKNRFKESYKQLYETTKTIIFENVSSLVLMFAFRSGFRSGFRFIMFMRLVFFR